MTSSQRVAVLTLQRLGDVLTAHRVTAGLAAQREVQHVELVHWDLTTQAAALLPGVSKHHALPHAALLQRREQSPLAAFAALRDHIERLRSRGFDRVVNVTSTPFACWLAPLLTRGEVVGPWMDDSGAYRTCHPALDYLNTWGVDPAVNVFAHQDLYTLAADVSLAPNAQLQTDEGVATFVQSRVLRVDEGPIALHLRSSAQEKDWREPLSVTGWRGLAAELGRRFKRPIVALGSPRQLEELSALSAATGAQVCAWPLRETAELLRRCRGLISVDTVSIHLAAQVGCPTIVLRQGSARGLAFVPGPRALLVDDARTHAGVGDLIHLTQRHILEDELRPRLARSLADRLQVRQGVIEAHGALGVAGPSWIPRSQESQRRDRIERETRARWMDAWRTRSTLRDTSTLAVGW